MDVPIWVWGITMASIVGLLAFDFFFHVRKAHVPTLKEASIWSAIYVGFAVVFGCSCWCSAAATMGAEYFAGYVTEKALVGRQPVRLPDHHGAASGCRVRISRRCCSSASSSR